MGLTYIAGNCISGRHQLIGVRLCRSNAVLALSVQCILDNSEIYGQKLRVSGFSLCDGHSFAKRVVTSTVRLDSDLHSTARFGDLLSTARFGDLLSTRCVTSFNYDAA